MGDAWTAIDFETANQDRGSACAVGLVRVRGGVVVDRLTTLIRPPGPVDFFSRHNTAVHGITASDVADAPGWGEVLERIVEFSDGGPLVAHNAAFDMGVLGQACRISGLSHPAWDYACTLAVSRRTWEELPDHRLPTVSAHVGHTITRHHRADADAEAAAHIMIAAMRRHGTASLPELAQASGARLRRLEGVRQLAPAPMPVSVPVAESAGEDRFSHWQRVSRTPLPQASPDADPSGPLYGRTVCVSGDLESMDKPEAWRRVAEAGGHPAKNVTKKTDVLVVGGTAGGGRTAKHRQAQTYRERGQRIDFVTEPELLALLGMTAAS
ncbi:DNA polymerase-3 subunit epsilon [Nocardiopsis sp. Huas11]|uniref:exonuclease domain-containing protein n=1 Tax=Nocardiopsis sp. Huas11 TaxID=2183912 RepID=UPI000EB282CB|nr:exonuclease domain-containing protein [Nocardiopsis sp. Huas11]RKS08817.1 DNA polymerase-3 subunit epsilon [Nocardiopsis sp. Huas11]